MVTEFIFFPGLLLSKDFLGISDDIKVLTSGV